MRTGLEYRPDIDGLRAVAVMVVVMYHLGVGFTKGGFIGVDVFFVISGYLITAIIAAEVKAGTYSLLGFYERRVRRLFPALFVVLIFSSCLAFVLLFPPELEYFGITLVATTTFLANILFYSGDGYFAGTRETIPLLHTWSLAVEEQFYLLFPLVLAPLLRRNKEALCWLIFWLTLLLSLAFDLYLVRYDQSGAFFLLPPRAWELLLGCLLALGAIPELRDERYRQWASIAGLLAILIAAAEVRSATFPGWAALVPCVGAAAVIHSGVKGDTVVYRALASRYAVFFGLISYSLYLWHWPIIAFYKAHHGVAISKPEMLVLGIASIAAATLSWRYIERPFRQRTVLPRRRAIFSAAAMASTSAMALAVLLLATEGLSNRYPASVRRLAAFNYKPEGPMRSGHCFVTNGYSQKPTVDENCLRLDTGRRNFLLVGDSFAAHHWAGLTAVFPEINFLQATASVCKPILEGGGAPRCRSVIDAAFLQFLPNHKLDGVILAGAWAASDIPRVVKTIEVLRKNVDIVYVFGAMILYDDMLPRLLARSESLQDPSLIGRHRQPNRRSWDQSFAHAVEASGARYVSFYKALCDSGDNCLTRDENGDPIQFDGGHLTRMGSVTVAKVLRDRRMLE